VELHTFRTAIERAWTSSTTYCPETWPEQDAAWGQCAVTSVLAWATFGGSLLKGVATDPTGASTSHYWNLFGSVEVDLTWRQFPAGTALSEVSTASRAALIANPWMEARYATLVSNAERELHLLGESLGPAASPADPCARAGRAHPSSAAV